MFDTVLWHPGFYTGKEWIWQWITGWMRNWLDSCTQRLAVNHAMTKQRANVEWCPSEVSTGTGAVQHLSATWHWGHHLQVHHWHQVMWCTQHTGGKECHPKWIYKGLRRMHVQNPWRPRPGVGPAPRKRHFCVQTHAGQRKDWEQPLRESSRYSSLCTCSPETTS